MPEDSPYADWRAILLKHVVSLIERLTPRWFKAVFVELFLTISPSVPVDLGKGLGDAAPKHLFLVSFALAAFFCFIDSTRLVIVRWPRQAKGEPGSSRFVGRHGQMKQHRSTN